MSTVKFKNGKELETLVIFGSSMTFQNANRKTLEIRIAEDTADYEELKAIYTDSEALSEIEVRDVTEVPTEDGKTEKAEVSSLHLHYTLPVELGSKQIDGESVWCMKIAQKSALELEQAKQAADINDTQLALIELAELISGGEG